MTPNIRVATAGDAAAIADIYAPVVTDTHVSFETTPPTPETMEDRISDTLSQFPWLVCEMDGAIRGYAYARPHNERPAYQWGVDVSVYVADGWRRNGLARGLYRSLFSILRRQGFYTAYAVIALPNPASVAFHEALGFERVGLYESAGFKRGAWHDVGHWERQLEDHETPPSPPTPFAEFRRETGLGDVLRTGEPGTDC